MRMRPSRVRRYQPGTWPLTKSTVGSAEGSVVPLRGWTRFRRGIMS